MLTLYYVSATFLQSWRISKICQKITEQLASQASVAFYALPATSGDGFGKYFFCINMIQENKHHTFVTY